MEIIGYSAVIIIPELKKENNWKDFSKLGKVFGDSEPLLSVIKYWTVKVKCDHTSNFIEEHSDHLFGVTTSEVTEKILVIVIQDLRVH